MLTLTFELDDPYAERGSAMLVASDYETNEVARVKLPHEITRSEAIVLMHITKAKLVTNAAGLVP